MMPKASWAEITREIEGSLFLANSIKQAQEWLEIKSAEWNRVGEGKCWNILLLRWNGLQNLNILKSNSNLVDCLSIY